MFTTTKEGPMTTIAAPARADLAGRAAELVPLLHRNALWTEEHRRLPDETITARATAA